MIWKIRDIGKKNEWYNKTHTGLSFLKCWPIVYEIFSSWIWIVLVADLGITVSLKKSDQISQQCFLPESPKKKMRVFFFEKYGVVGGPIGYLPSFSDINSILYQFHN